MRLKKIVCSIANRETISLRKESLETQYNTDSGSQYGV